MADVFISCHEKSAGQTAKIIADALEERGISCWYADRDMRTGDFAGVITRAIRECRVFLLILTKDAERSVAMESEATLVLRRVVNYENVSVIPFRMEKFDLKESPSLVWLSLRFHEVDGCPPDAEHIQALVSRILRTVKRENPRPPARPSQQA